MVEDEQANGCINPDIDSLTDSDSSLTVRIIITGPSGTAVIRMKVAGEAIIRASDL